MPRGCAAVAQRGGTGVVTVSPQRLGGRWQLWGHSAAPPAPEQPRTPKRLVFNPGFNIRRSGQADRALLKRTAAWLGNVMDSGFKDNTRASLLHKWSRSKLPAGGESLSRTVLWTNLAVLH